MTTFLTDAELVELTGYRRPSYQIAKLRSYGLRFFIAADGHPRVARSEIEGRKQEPPKTRPDFAALQAAVKRAG